MEKNKLDREKYAEINELTGRFYAFSVQIDLDGKITEEGLQVSPFFYAVLCMIKAEGINVNIMQENIWKLNEEVNEILKQNNIRILEFEDVTIVKNIIFDKTGTLTKGEFEIQKIEVLSNYNEQEVLKYAAMGERFSNHPIAKSIIKANKEVVEEEDEEDTTVEAETEEDKSDADVEKEPVDKFTGKIIVIVQRKDDVEEKWVVVPDGVTFSKEEIRRQIHFQEQYFDSEIVM